MLEKVPTGGGEWNKGYSKKRPRGKLEKTTHTKRIREEKLGAGSVCETLVMLLH